MENSALALTDAQKATKAARAGRKRANKAAAKAAWNRGKEYLNGYLRIVNFPISSKVGDKFPLVEATL